MAVSLATLAYAQPLPKALPRLPGRRAILRPVRGPDDDPSTVWWSPLAPARCPPVIKACNGTGMAIVGWEIDQVRQTPGGDVSVPISASYNHHYVSRILGAGAKFSKAKLDGPSDPRAQKLIKQSGHGMIAYEQEQYLLEDTEGDDDPLISARSGLPSHQAFSSANGGEYRKTYHGFAPGYALVVDSPTSFQVTPMQIDSWNREKMDISKDGPKPVKFVPGRCQERRSRRRMPHTADYWSAR